MQGKYIEFNEPHVRESSAIILFAHNPEYKRENYAEVVDKGIEDGRTKPENREESHDFILYFLGPATIDNVVLAIVC
jgi:hypothetical protein